ncbi:Glyco-hydro-cc domain-containing protein [Mycena kentingensis (nom. inval.)]|nr:Glyco-hydro-cc domain-containing protein [Mycena kentingensis (nom. inval.)]
MKLSVATGLLALAFACSASPTPAANATEKRSGPGKRGLAWPWYNSPLNPARFKDAANSVNLIYDYETYSPPSSNGLGGLFFIGMQRCMDCDSSPISQLAARQKQLGFVTLFTLNEPDINGISPTAAVNWYIQWINPFTIHKALPAITSSASTNQGLSWLQQFVNICAGRCFFDYINLHWYGTSAQAFKDYITHAHSLFPNTQIVVTEFALIKPAGGQAAQAAFFRDTFAFLDGLSYVAMYFPFVATTPALFSANDPAGAAFVGTGSTLYNNDGTVSAVGAVMLA